MMADENEGAPESSLSDWVIGLPKAEVHVHLEGTIQPALLAEAAGRAGVNVPPADFSDLAEFLVVLDRRCSLLTERSDLVTLARDHALQAQRNGVGYSDAIVNPTHWPSWLPRMSEMISALDDGFSEAEARGAPPTGLCISLGRWQSEEEAGQLLDFLGDHPDDRVVGISLDGNEAAPGSGTERFVPAVRRARSLGLGVAVHAGESSGPEGVRQAIDLLQPDRIDHGIRAVEDPSLVGELANSRVPLDICPSSNVRLGVVPGLGSHPIDALLRAGVCVSVNTDDPVLFDTDLVHEYVLCIEQFGWLPSDVEGVARASIESSFASPELKSRLLGDLSSYASTGWS
jgi:adenosine deaminase